MIRHLLSLSVFFWMLFYVTVYGQWTRMQGLVGVDGVNGLATSGSNLFIKTGTSGTLGVFSSSDSGVNWNWVSLGLPTQSMYTFHCDGPYPVIYLPPHEMYSSILCFCATSNGSSGSNLFAGTYCGFFSSANSGLNWSPIPWPNNGYVNYLTANRQTVFAFVDLPQPLPQGATSGPYRSLDNGLSWTRADSGLPHGSKSSSFVGASPDGTNLFVSMYGGLFRSSDNGVSWTSITATNSGLPSSLDEAESFAVQADGTGDTILFLGTYTPNHVFHSSNNGANWTEADSGVDTTGFVSCFAVSGSTIFAGIVGGTIGGVYQSSNYGANWTAVNTGLTGMNISSLVVFGDYLFLANGWVFRRPLSEMSQSTVVKARNSSISHTFSVHIDKNRVVQYALPKESIVSIRVFDVRGRMVLSEINSRQAAGAYSRPLRLEGLSAGYHMMDFRAGNFNMRQGFTVVR
jgi:hypothetical protein